MLGLLLSYSLGQLALGAALGLAVLVIADGFFPAARLKLRHIPGPSPWWLVGNTLEIAATHDYFLYKAWEVWGQKYGKVFKWFWGPQPVVTVRDAHVARSIMVKHFKVFPDRSMFYPPQNPTVSRVLATGITFAKGTYWNGLRSALQPMFHSTGLASHQPLVEAAVEELCEDLKPAADAGGSVDMHAALGNVALKAIGEAAFGVKFDTHTVVDGQMAEHPIVHAANVALENTGKTLTWMLTPPLLKPLVWRAVALLPPPLLASLNVARMQLYTAALTLARNAMERLGTPWDDELRVTQAFDRPETRPLAQMYAGVVPAQGSVVDLLARSRNKQTGQPLKPHEIVAQVNSVVVAGHDTTSFCLTSTLYWVSQTPAAQQKLRAELDAFGRHRAVTVADMDKLPYLEACVRESLRLSPPGWMTTREALEDILMPGGLFLPRGTVVYIDIRGIQRDPDFWLEPDAFQPERFLDKSPEAQERNQLAWLAFGAGPRTCIGYKFALNEVKTVLATLWQHYDFAVDTSKTPLPPLLRPGITLGYREGLQFTVKPRA